MSIYPRGRRPHGSKRSPVNKTVLMVIGVIAVAVVAFFVIRGFVSTPGGVQLEQILLEQARQESKLANDTAGYLSRLGGSVTLQQLAQTRQHLYALQQLNSLSVQTLGSNRLIVPPEAIDEAMIAITEAENIALMAQVIDEPLVRLQEQLRIITAALSTSVVTE